MSNVTSSLVDVFGQPIKWINPAPAAAPAKVYAKTNRTRVTDEEKVMVAEVQRTNSETGSAFSVSRSSEKKYARALFDLFCKGELVQLGLTYNEVVSFVTMFRSVYRIETAEVVQNFLGEDVQLAA